MLSLISLIQFGIDKKRARKGQWRIPEKMLLLTAALGGSLGSILGMKLFHHKTRHRKFSVGLPVILGVQVLVVFGLWYLQHQ